MSQSVGNLAQFFRSNIVAATFGVVAISIPITAPVCAHPTFSVIHDFTGGADGGGPVDAPVADGKHRFIGATFVGGTKGYGLVYRLVHGTSGWQVKPIYNIKDKDGGQLYWGVTLAGGYIYANTSAICVEGSACGTVLQIKGSHSVIIHTYILGEDNSPIGNLVLDGAGNVFGATYPDLNNPNSRGSIIELSYSRGSWKEKILYSFQGKTDGGTPESGPILDAAGNLYGTLSLGGADGYGTVYELSPGKSGWKYKLLYTFTGGNDGGLPFAGLIFDPAGNLYGSTFEYGKYGGGTVFELSPSQGVWNFSLLASLTGINGPAAPLAMDSKGTIYGATYYDGAYGDGSVFRLTPSLKGWKYKDLHDFTGGADGDNGDGVVLDAHDNLYGDAGGGAYGQGVIYKITR